MGELQAIVYVSTAVQLMTEASLTALLADAREFNSRHGVTGSLLYGDGGFLQYFEGPRAGMDLVYERIKAAKTHHRIIELLNETVPERRFASWHMGFAQAPKTIILRLSQARWMEVAARKGTEIRDNDGVAVLMDYWQNLRRVTPGSAGT